MFKKKLNKKKRTKRKNAIILLLFEFEVETAKDKIQRNWTNAVTTTRKREKKTETEPKQTKASIYGKKILINFKNCNYNYHNITNKQTNKNNVLIEISEQTKKSISLPFIHFCLFITFASFFCCCCCCWCCCYCCCCWIF